MHLTHTTTVFTSTYAPKLFLYRNHGFHFQARADSGSQLLHDGDEEVVVPCHDGDYDAGDDAGDDKPNYYLRKKLTEKLDTPPIASFG